MICRICPYPPDEIIWRGEDLASTPVPFDSPQTDTTPSEIYAMRPCLAIYGTGIPRCWKSCWWHNRKFGNGSGHTKYWLPNTYTYYSSIAPSNNRRPDCSRNCTREFTKTIFTKYVHLVFFPSQYNLWYNQSTQFSVCTYPPPPSPSLHCSGLLA